MRWAIAPCGGQAEEIQAHLSGVDLLSAEGVFVSPHFGGGVGVVVDKLRNPDVALRGISTRTMTWPVIP